MSVNPALVFLIPAFALFGCSAPRSSLMAPEAPPAPAAPVASGLESDPFLTDALLAVLWPGVDPTAVATDHGLVLDGVLPDGLSCRFLIPAGADPVQLEAELNADSRVDGASLDFILTDSESRQSSFAFDEGFLDIQQVRGQNLLTRLGLPAAHRVSIGSGVLVAVLDTGADLDHPLLAGRIRPGGHDFVDDDDDPSDVPDGIDNDGDGVVDEATGHGSHVAGIVAMVAPGAELLILRVLDSDGRGPTFQVARAIEYAVDAGADVINMSLGVLAEPRALDEALTYADARGVILVGAAGNWGAELPEEFPASSRKVWSVAASDSLDQAASFTSYSRHITISAPGTSIRSSYWNGGYAVWSGTSMAAPTVSGTIALLRALHPDWTRDGIRQRIGISASPVTPLTSDQIGALGMGRIDVGRAVAQMKPSAPPRLPERASS